MLTYEWPGNITEMRQRIVAALDATDKEWLTPVDLGIYQRGAGGRPRCLLSDAVKRPFLEEVEKQDTTGGRVFSPSALEELDTALGEAVNRGD